MTISSPTGGGGQTPARTVVHQYDDIRRAILLSDPPDDRPDLIDNIDIRLSVTPNSVNEDAGTTEFTVTATHDAGTTRTEDITIELTLGGTADESDYTAPAQASVTIQAGEPSGTGSLILTLIDDELIEGDKTIIVGGSFTGLIIGSALITIHDDDSPISIDPTDPPSVPIPPPYTPPSPTPTPEVTPTPTPTPEATPTPTPTPEATPIPTATPEATPIPTPTPEATPTPTATPEATPIPTPTPGGDDTHIDAGGDAHTHIDAGGNVHSHSHAHT